MVRIIPTRTFADFAFLVDGMQIKVTKSVHRANPELGETERARPQTQQSESANHHWKTWQHQDDPSLWRPGWETKQQKGLRLVDA
jgi:hypothetical protein